MEHLIPPAWFVGMPWWLLLLIAAAALVVLSRGADWLVQGASTLAVRLGIPKIIIGATIVSLGTTTPEAAVSVMAAWRGEAGLALGNAVGSIIADTALIFGLGCLLVALPADRFVLQRQGWVQFGAGALLAVLCYGAFVMHGDEAALPRWAGVLLVVLLVVYMAFSVRWARQHSVGEPFIVPDEIAEQEQQARGLPMILTLAVIGLVLIIFGSHVLIVSVSELATQVGVPKVMIAATLVALGTSLPELVVGLTAIRRGHPELLVGNVIGADILNVLFVVGAAAVASPLPVVEAHPSPAMARVFLYLHLPVMLGVLLLFRVFIFSAVRRGSFRRWYGYPLLAIYVGYVLLQLGMSQGWILT